VTALNLLLATGVGATIGAIVYTVDWLVGDDVPGFWLGLMHDWTTGLGVLAIILTVIAWAARAADLSTVVAIVLGFFGAEVGAYVSALLWAVLSAAWGLLPDFLKPEAP